MSRFITLLLAETSLETIPAEIKNDLSVRKYLSKMKKTSNEVILDTNLHINLMKNLKDSKQRGRPDIAHFAILAAYGSLLSKREKLQMFIHTYNDKLIILSPNIRPPKSIERFKGLILQLFDKMKIPVDSKEPLMEIQDKTLPELMKSLRKKHDLIVEFTVNGEKMTSHQYSSLIHSRTNPLLIFGGFSTGHLKSLPKNFVDYHISIYNEGLDLFAVISHVLSSIHNFEELSLEKKETKEGENLSWL